MFNLGSIPSFLWPAGLFRLTGELPFPGSVVLLFAPNVSPQVSPMRLLTATVLRRRELDIPCVNGGIYQSIAAKKFPKQKDDHFKVESSSL